jgi:hypothetical protein
MFIDRAIVLYYSSTANFRFSQTAKHLQPPRDVTPRSYSACSMIVSCSSSLLKDIGIQTGRDKKKNPRANRYV